MRSYEAADAKRSSEEELLVAFNNGAYAVVADGFRDMLERGRSPNVLSVVRPELLLGFAESLLSTETGDTAEDRQTSTSHGENDLRSGFFEATMARAGEGDAGAISALPKFATSPAQLATAMELALDNREAITDWRSERPYVQMIGSFNPQHIGHRSTMRTALEAAGERASLTVQVVANHPVKKDSLPPYEGRYRGAEYYTYQSLLIDPDRVTVLDVPLDSGLSKNGAAQIELLADVTGDPAMRWLIGSDKFMSDVRTAREGEDEEKRAIVRFREPRMHLYVARRAVHDLAEVEDGIDFVRDRFGTAITLVEEAPDEQVLAASASRIRQLRSEGRDEEADRMQFTDLTVGPA